MKAFCNSASKADNLNIQVIEQRIEHLQHHWNNFQIIQDAIEIITEDLYCASFAELCGKKISRLQYEADTIFLGYIVRLMYCLQNRRASNISLPNI